MIPWVHVLPHYSLSNKGPIVRTFHLLSEQYHSWWLLGGHSQDFRRVELLAQDVGISLNLDKCEDIPRSYHSGFLTTEYSRSYGGEPRVIHPFRLAHWWG